MTLALTVATPELDARLTAIEAAQAEILRRLDALAVPVAEDRLCVGLNEAARLLDRDRQAVTRLADVGLIERFYDGRKPMFPVAGLRLYVEREAAKEAAKRAAPTPLRRAS